MTKTPNPIDSHEPGNFHLVGEGNNAGDGLLSSDSALDQEGKVFQLPRSHGMRRLMDSGTRRSIAAGVAGFIVYGSWALYINSQHGISAGIKAGFVQGTYSFALTVSATMLMEFLWTSLQTAKGPVFLTISITNAITFITAYLINWVFGTPEIFLTIFPGFLIGILYTSFYVASLRRFSRINPAN